MAQCTYTKSVTAHAKRKTGQILLQGSSFGSGSSDNDCVLHGIVLLKGLDELSDGGSLLTNSDVDAVQLLGLVGT